MDGKRGSPASSNNPNMSYCIIRKSKLLAIIRKESKCKEAAKKYEPNEFSCYDNNEIQREDSEKPTIKSQTLAISSRVVEPKQQQQENLSIAKEEESQLDEPIKMSSCQRQSRLGQPSARSIEGDHVRAVRKRRRFSFSASNQRGLLKAIKINPKTTPITSWPVLLLLILLGFTLTDWSAPRDELLPASSAQIKPDEIIYKQEAFLTTLFRLFASRRAGTVLLASAQYSPIWPNKELQQEIFLLNLEDGYFGCQVNESQDFLQLFELSKLCDGQTQCYLGTDELVQPLKCTSRDRCGVGTGSGSQQQQFNSKQHSSSLLNGLSTALANNNWSSNNSLSKQRDGYQCVNGVCLDGLCYCNDGWGGKSCDIPDENECKFRPCDVFAHCTNTMGSYYCSCFPGKFYGSKPREKLLLRATFNRLTSLKLKFKWNENFKFNIQYKTTTNTIRLASITIVPPC